MCANPQSNWLNTIAGRASYILPSNFLRKNQEKTGGGGGVWSISPRKKTKTETSLSF